MTWTTSNRLDRWITVQASYSSIFWLQFQSWRKNLLESKSTIRRSNFYVRRLETSRRCDGSVLSAYVDWVLRFDRLESENGGKRSGAKTSWDQGSLRVQKRARLFSQLTLTWIAPFFDSNLIAFLKIAPPSSGPTSRLKLSTLVSQ